MSQYRRYGVQVRDITEKDTNQLLNQFRAPDGLKADPMGNGKFCYGNGGTLYMVECLDPSGCQVDYLITALDDGRSYISKPYYNRRNASKDFSNIMENMANEPLDESVNYRRYDFQSRKWLME